tara:strand:+ start:32 stop:583 length:552 start_codon:yes stop_codon:yes gene_type:complete
MGQTKDIENKLILVSGPSRGGKSLWAENLIKENKQVIYIATNQGEESDLWAKRVNIHKQRRPKSWQVIEAPNNIIESINNSPIHSTIVIDSLGGYIAKYIQYHDYEWNQYQDKFINYLSQKPRNIVIVIEETGWGIVPSTKIGNLFRDRIGFMAQQLQVLASESWLVIQGRAINLQEISIAVK